MKVISLGTDELDEYDFARIKKAEIKADSFVYHYENYGYEGSGFAVWKKGDKWSYHELGHCSCYGPTQNIEASDKMEVTKEELISLLEKHYTPLPELIQYVHNN